MNLVDGAYKSLLAHMFKDWHNLSVDERRLKEQQLDKFIRLSKNAEFKQEYPGGVPSMHITPKGKYEKAIIYFHGGAYVLKGTKNHLNLCADIATKADAQVWMVDYRLAPENPFPCALEDAVAVYKNLIGAGNITKTIILGGDSAGGGLALSLLAEIREQGMPMPGCVFCFSPWTDLTLSGQSHSEKAKEDPILKTYGLAQDARDYADNFQLNDPRISPLFSSMHKFPPILLQVGTNEILLDDAKKFYEKAKAQSVPIELEIWPNMYHVFQILPFLPEKDEAIVHVISFIERSIEKRVLA